MVQRTIYLSDEDATYVDQHRDVIGTSLSSAFMEGLRMVVSRNELRHAGFEEVRLDVGRPGTPKLKVFDGRMMARSRSVVEAGTVVVSRRIYTTPKGAWVYFERSAINWEQWSSAGTRTAAEVDEAVTGASFDAARIDGHRTFEVRGSLAELDGLAPPDLVAAARAESEDSSAAVERLDI